MGPFEVNSRFEDVGSGNNRGRLSCDVVKSISKVSRDSALESILERLPGPKMADGEGGRFPC